MKSDGRVGPLSLQGDSTQRDKQPFTLTSIGNLESQTHITFTNLDSGRKLLYLRKKQ